jgi:hypothetical protein
MVTLQDKMVTALQLAFKLAYETIDGTSGNYFDVREQWPYGKNDQIWLWADGLMHGYYNDHVFESNADKFELEVDKDISDFTAMLKLYGEPKVLTREELIARGYKR